MTLPAAAAGRPGRNAIAAILALYAVLVLLRVPQIALLGRFWAEEGTVFFATAWTRPPLSALLTSYAGYLNLAANAATLAARYALPLEWAPYATIATGLAVQLAPPSLLLLARDAWLQDWRARAAAILLLLFVPAADEIWLQVLHCQFELTLCCALILALDARPRAALPLLLLLLAPLCGLGAIALLPLFALRALLDRSIARTLQCAALVAGSALQLAFFFRIGTDRLLTTDPAILLPVITLKHLVVPFLGTGTARRLAGSWRDATAHGRLLPLAAVFPVIGSIGIVAASIRARNWTALWLLAAAALTAGAGYFGALEGPMSLLDEMSGQRYAFVPQSLLAMTFLSLAALPGHPAPRALGAALCLWLLMSGVQQYRRPWNAVAFGPAWRPEVAAWRADPAHTIQIWPQGWTMTLDPAHR